MLVLLPGAGCSGGGGTAAVPFRLEPDALAAELYLSLAPVGDLLGVALEEVLPPETKKKQKKQ